MAASQVCAAEFTTVWCLCSFVLDPHFTAATGMLTALRVQFEFDKMRRYQAPEPHEDTSIVTVNPTAGALGASTASEE